MQVAWVLQRQAAQAFVVFLQQGVVHAHSGCQFTKNLRIGFGLTHGRDGGAIQHHVGVAIAVVNVPVLKLRGRGQHIVGMVGGVGHKVFQHHGEQIFSRKAFHYLGRLGSHRHGVAVVDHQGFDQALRIQGVADGAHVDERCRCMGVQIGALQSYTIVQSMT